MKKSLIAMALMASLAAWAIPAPAPTHKAAASADSYHGAPVDVAKGGKGKKGKKA